MESFTNWALALPAARGLASGAVALSMVAFAAPASADKIDIEHAVHLSGEQSALMQMMSADLLLAGMGNEPNKRLENLKKYRAEFARRLRALRRGDPALFLPAATQPEVLQSLTDVDALWPRFDAVLGKSLDAGAVSASEVDAVGLLSEPLLDAMERMATAFEAEASKGQLHSVLGRAVHFGERGHMLSQKMTTELLFIAYGGEAQKQRKELAQARAQFDGILKGLMDGDGNLRLLPAPTPEIRLALRNVQRAWDEFQPIVTSVAQGGEIAADDLSSVADASLALSEAIEEAVHMYEDL